MRKINLAAIVCALAALAAGPATASARLAAPRLLNPANGIHVQQLPAISWKSVRGAHEYEYEISADPQFRSILGSGSGKATSKTHNLAAALDQDVADGTYYWRVRGLTALGNSGAWSGVRTIVKRWTVQPRITAGNGVAVRWPNTPLVLSWSPVPYAVKYIVWIATDPALSNVVLGSPSQPEYTEASSFVLPGTLANGTYYWALTPVDAQGHRGARSNVASFTWTWPTTTTVSMTDLNPTVFDPLFSWKPIPGAARYEVEINTHPNFPAGSKWCCNTPTIGTSLAPQQALANNSTYWWRVRGIDANGNAGQWNVGSTFTKAFDSVTPSIPNLTVRDANGNALSGTPSTDTPIVTWSPVPGASRYEVQIGPYSGYCDWSHVSSEPYHAYTASTAWTPLGFPTTRPGPSAWPYPQYEIGPLPLNATYCVRVLARSDDDAQSQQVVSNWSYVNGADDANTPAFTYAPPPATVSQTFAPFTPANAYIGPATGAITPRTPLFTWNWMPGAKGYFVVIARDRGFTDVADVGFTNVPAYAPRIDNSEPLADKSSAYYWAVVPTQNADGTGFNDPFGGGSNGSQDNPQSFSKSSVAPVSLAPASGANVSTWPTFEWTSAENARNYELQVSQDPSFGTLLDDVTTDATAYTSSTTYPADTVLYWRVRGNDWLGQGLNWSAVHTFTRRLPSAAPASGNPTAGDALPVLSWNPVPGAIAYDVHIDQGNGLSNDYTVDSAAFAPIARQGIGTVHWQVRPMFPTVNSIPIGGAFFAPRPYLMTLGPPSGAQGVRRGSRIIISWNPDPAAKQYEVDVANTDTFSSMIDFHRVDGTSWAPDIDFSIPSYRGRLYWRVAALSTDGTTVGSFATGSFAPRRHRRHH